MTSGEDNAQPSSTVEPRDHSSWLVADTIIRGVPAHALKLGGSLHLYALSGDDPAILGYAYVASFLPAFIGTFIGGVLAERLELRRLVSVEHVVGLPLAVSLVFVTDIVPFLIILALASLMSGLSGPAAGAATPLLVPHWRIASLSGRLTAIGAVITIVTPLVAGFIYDHAQSIAPLAYAEAVSRALSALLWLSLPVCRPSGAGERIRLFVDAFEGLRHALARPPILFTILTASILGLFVQGIVVPLMMPFVSESFGGGEREYGIMMSSFSAGAVIGALIGGSGLPERVGRGRYLVVAMAGAGLCCFAHPFSSTLYASVPLLFTWGIIQVSTQPVRSAFLLTGVASTHRGRILALNSLNMSFPIILGSALVATLANEVGTVGLLHFAGTAFVVLTVATPLVWRSGWRQLDAHTVGETQQGST
jgi:MFS family permease